MARTESWAAAFCRRIDGVNGLRNRLRQWSGGDNSRHLQRSGPPLIAAE